MLVLKNTHVEKFKNLREQNFKGLKGMVTQIGRPHVTAKELTSRQKEKPHSKENNLTTKKNLTAKRITSRQKEKHHGKRRKTHGKGQKE